jgi:hypothetical protein
MRGKNTREKEEQQSKKETISKFLFKGVRKKDHGKCNHTPSGYLAEPVVFGTFIQHKAKLVITVT